MATLELLNKIAEGSAAEAFLARTDTETVLVELSRPGLSDDTELYGRFLDEARERQKLQHKNLVNLTGAGCRQDGRLYAVSESLSGLHLGTLGPLPADQALRFIIPLCEALSYLHERGVMHGHLRPSHVFLSGPIDNPVPKLLDMGLLLFRSTKSLKTPTKMVLVPPEYLSPERICGQRASPRSDVYGLGVLTYELIVGRAPFKGRDAEETRRLHMTASVPALPGDSAWLQPWLDKCLQKDVNARFASMNEVRDALLEANMARLTGAQPAHAAERHLAQLEAQPERGHTAQPERGHTVQPERGHTVNMRAVDEPPVVRGKLESEAKQLGPYELESLLGEGGMGQVWLARHTRLERKVAIKLLKPELVRVESQVQRFFDEARAVNRVNHPHIVEITDFVEERDMGRVWTVMEYLKGATLKTVGREEPLPIARSVKIMRQVCDALDAAHAVGVVHRDVKPDNIFLVEWKGEGDFVKVLDFGVAKLREERGSSGNTDAGEIVGTPAYMSPEQALGQDVDPRSDLYSLGTLLYVLLCGRFPFEGITAGQMVANIVSRPPIELPELTRSGEPISAELRGIVMKCLEKEPSQRYQSMRELAEALVPFEQTQKLLAVTDDDLVIEDTGELEAVADVPIEGAGPRPKRRALRWLAVTALIASAATAARIVWPEVQPLVIGKGGAGAAAASAMRFTHVAGGPVEVNKDAKEAEAVVVPSAPAVISATPGDAPAATAMPVPEPVPAKKIVPGKRPGKKRAKK